MHDVAVIDDPAAAMAARDPIKARLLAELSAPASAATLAARIGLPRQKVNYHLRALEALELVESVEQRRCRPAGSRQHDHLLLRRRSGGTRERQRTAVARMARGAVRDCEGGR